MRVLYEVREISGSHFCLLQGSPPRSNQNKIYGGYPKNTPKNTRLAKIIYEYISFLRQDRTLYIVSLLGYNTLQYGWWFPEFRWKLFLQLLCES